MREIELLSPARNSEIGIAAIDCGADSVYIAAPKYGARVQAGNSFEDIKVLCAYAHRFGAKVYLTLNTILYNNELKEAQAYLWEAYRSGIDAVIVQDFALLKMDRPPIPLFASTQTDIRTPEKAALLEALGFKRLILARELSLEQIREIRKATSAELEFFVHGALCVSCSGQCYLSQYLTGRSANRGECAQACRSNYDLVDENGNVLVKDTPLLSLKDFNLSSRLEDLIDAGITSFKIEGRLKNISYVKNIVRKYDLALNAILEKKNAGGAALSRPSWGRSRCTFVPDEEKTFNRGYTEFFLDGRRGDFKSKDSAKGLGEYIGVVSEVSGDGKSFVRFSYKADCSSGGKANNPTGGKAKTIHNSDGLCFAAMGRITTGFRANSCNGNTVELFTKDARIKKGDLIYRNFDYEFEKTLENIPPRIIDVDVDLTLFKDSISATVTPVLHSNAKGSGKGGQMMFSFDIQGEEAKNPESAKDLTARQIGKTALHYSFNVKSVGGKEIFFYRTSALNGIRAELAKALEQHLERDSQRTPATANAEANGNTKANANASANAIATANANVNASAAEKPDYSRLKNLAKAAFKEGESSYLRNCSNRLSKQVYKELGLKDIQPAYEQKSADGATLMQCRYCIRHQLGLCPKDRNTIKDNSTRNNRSSKISRTGNDSRTLYLRNGSTLLPLTFNCSRCEMQVKSTK
ncbi:MAG: U32 family peptidase [Bacteroidales bacterium]|nr:U32 family peptidase [Bacteroidales bacterium]